MVMSNPTEETLKRFCALVQGYAKGKAKFGPVNSNANGMEQFKITLGPAHASVGVYSILEAEFSDLSGGQDSVDKMAALTASNLLGKRPEDLRPDLWARQEERIEEAIERLKDAGQSVDPPTVEDMRDARLAHEEANKKPLEVTTSAAQPAKRGRGRPRKVDPPTEA
jgi:hypothetical protein